MHPALTALTLAALLVGLTGPAMAACYADYRAQRDTPFGLHYGVIEIPDTACSTSAAAAVISQRIARDGWQLLQVISVFDDSGLQQRRSDAGTYFLRF